MLTEKTCKCSKLAWIYKNLPLCLQIVLLVQRVNAHVSHRKSGVRWHLHCSSLGSFSSNQWTYDDLALDRGFRSVISRTQLLYMSSWLALIFVTCGSGQMAAVSKHWPAQRLWAALIGWCLSRTSHVTLKRRRVLSSDLGLYLAAQCRSSAHGSRCTFPHPHLSICGLFVCPPTPPCSLWMHGFHVVPPSAHPPPPPGLVKPTAWDHVCVFVLAEDVLQSCGWIPVSLNRCMTLKQGEKLTLSIHLQECGADFRVAQQLKLEAARSCSQSRLQVVES